MTGLSDDARTELLTAWAVWDNKAARTPRHPRRPPDGWLLAEATRKIDAENTAAGQLGYRSGCDLWRDAVAFRQQGLCYEDSLTALENDVFDDGRGVW